MTQPPPSSLIRQYAIIFAAVVCYWICSISMVFVNKDLLSNPLNFNLLLFLTGFQCICSAAIFIVLSALSSCCSRLIDFPGMTIDLKTQLRILPLSCLFVGMVICNNLCLKHVGVSFYYIARSLTMIFNVVLSYVILRKLTSKRALLCCLIIFVGFCLGVNQENAAGSLSTKGVVFGVLASLFTALNAIYTKKLLDIVDNSVWRLSYLQNLNGVFIILPIMLFNGGFVERAEFEQIGSICFWLMMCLGGFLAFSMGVVSAWQIQLTSPLTHNISSTAKAATQTVMSVMIWQEVKSILWWGSNAVVLLGSSAYTFVQKQDIDRKFAKEQQETQIGERAGDNEESDV